MNDFLVPIDHDADLVIPEMMEETFKVALCDPEFFLDVAGPDEDNFFYNENKNYNAKPMTISNVTRREDFLTMN